VGVVVQALLLLLWFYRTKSTREIKEHEVITSRLFLFPLLYTSVLQSRVIISVFCSHFIWYKY